MPERRVKRHSVTQPSDTSYKIIPLTRGYNAFVSTEDFDEISKYPWMAMKGKWGTYATTDSAGGRTILMHRMVTCALPGEEVDHINRDTLDNRRNNLRRCTRSENARNRIGNHKATSKFKGVWWDTERAKWAALIEANGRKYSIGRFKVEEDAARAYDKMAIFLHGDFAKTNF